MVRRLFEKLNLSCTAPLILLLLQQPVSFKHDGVFMSASHCGLLRSMLRGPYELLQCLASPPSEDGHSNGGQAEGRGHRHPVAHAGRKELV
mmetsp:Transcript_21175/g.41302  ORF Transcript_21175/g.41302 Transcript_21175/m.41302 type:complete len:91 (-) Transcript_21175:17-289(-)